MGNCIDPSSTNMLAYPLHLTVMSKRMKFYSWCILSHPIILTVQDKNPVNLKWEKSRSLLMKHNNAQN